MNGSNLDTACVTANINLGWGLDENESLASRGVGEQKWKFSRADFVFLSATKRRVSGQLRGERLQRIS
jgi:hypothetical protein